MKKGTSDRQSERDHHLSLLRSLCDEIGLELHLVGMDARYEWAKLEPRVSDLLRRGAQLGTASRRAAKELVASADRLRASLPGRADAGRSMDGSHVDVESLADAQRADVMDARGVPSRPGVK